MFSPAGVRIALSVSSLRKWMLAKADVRSAFSQTGNARHNVYVIPPHESADRSHYWLVLTAAYCLVYANAKWQDELDELIYKLGL